MGKAENLFIRFITVLFFGTLLAFLILAFAGYDGSISWKVTTQAFSEPIQTLPFQKGPFQFSFESSTYSLSETFSAGPIQRNLLTESGLTLIIILGICILIAGCTYLSRWPFIFFQALFIFFLINLHLPEVRLFGFDDTSSMAVIVVLVAYIFPGYLFHAFYNHLSIIIRMLYFVLITILLMVFSEVDLILLQDQFTVGSYFGLIILSLVFLFIIAEENVFAILWMITKSRGGKNNHLHFSAFTLIYLILLGTYYGKKSGLIGLEFLFFDPFVLLSISTLVAYFTLTFKRAQLEKVAPYPIALIIFCSLGILTLSFLGLSFQRGNDPVYQGMHYFIVYAHFAFGTMFFLYIISNFINPLSRGFQIYKIAYQERNFPYVSAKIGGLVAIAAFFFLSRNEPWLLFQAGNYNYLGAQAEYSGNELLAARYYREGSVFGHDNHYSNYQLAYRELLKGDAREANYRFGRATLRFPSAQAYINYAGTHISQGETGSAIAILEEALRKYPDNSKLLNNLAMIHANTGNSARAAEILKRSESDDKWNDALLVNTWKIASRPNPEKDYQTGNLAVKTNILNHLLKSNEKLDLKVDTAHLQSAYPLHLSAFLNNASTYFESSDLIPILERPAGAQVNEEVYWKRRKSLALYYYKVGEINRALEILDQMRAEASSRFKGEIFHSLGLLALDQGKPALALSYLENAIAYGSQESFLPKTSALLELGRLKAAVVWVDKLSKSDSSYQSVFKDLNAILVDEKLTTEQQLIQYYYFYNDYSLEELSRSMEGATPTFIRSFWTKISTDFMKKEQFDSLGIYERLFRNYLNQEAFAEADAIQAAYLDLDVVNGHPLSKAMQENDTSIRIESLIKIAEGNSFNSPLVKAVGIELMKLDKEAAYNILVRAIDINRTSVALYKLYVMVALQNGLEQYAESVFDDLAALTSDTEYQLFLNQYYQAKEELAQKSNW